MSVLSPDEIRACRSIIGTPWRAMPTISRLVVVVADPPTTLPWLPLPRPRPVAVPTVAIAIEGGVARLVMGPGIPAGQPAPAAAGTPEELRARNEREARGTAQPDDWAHRVYESVSGLRWRCCGNRFEEDHCPWCEA